MTAIERGYRKSAMEFAAYGKNANYPCYALVEESGELLEAANGGEKEHVIGEIGDLCWMVAGICTEMKIPWHDVVSMCEKLGEFKFEGSNDSVIPATGAFLIAVEVSKIAGKIAKFIRKEDGISPVDAQDWVTKRGALDVFNKDMFMRLVTVTRIAIAIAKVLGYTFPAVLSANIRKLEERKATGTIVGSGETVSERKANAEKGA